jgi:hypothetical protein
LAYQTSAEKTLLEVLKKVKLKGGFARPAGAKHMQCSNATSAACELAAKPQIATPTA